MKHILGQQKPLAALTGSLQSGRFHHAWIFSGPLGVGKFTTARWIAGALLSGEPTAGGTEVDAETDRRIEAGTHPDLHVIRKELALYSDNPQLRSRKLMNIPLDLLRERMIGGRTADDRNHEAPAYRTAALGHGKVFIVDEAELLDAQAQNSLLKTLEEPPAQTYFFLITSRPERLLPTIRSRCQHVRFGPLDDEAMQAWFQRSGLDLDAGQRRWIERFADGSPGKATLAAEYGFDRWQATLDPMLDELQAGRYPVDLGPILAELVETFATQWVKNNDNASKDAANKDGARHLFSVLASFARQRLSASVDAGTDTQPWLDVIDLLCETEQQMYANVNLKMLLENLSARWATASV